MSQRSARCLFPAVLLAVSCGNGGSPSSPPDIQRRVALHAVSSCDELAGQVHDAAVHLMRADLDQLKTGYGSPGILAPGASNAGGSAPAPSGPPASYSTTNTQVAGVDEADFMKNDGTRIFTLTGQALLATTSWPPQDLALAGALPIEGWPDSMFLDGNTVVVLSSLGATITAGNWARLPCPACPMGAMCPAACGGVPLTKVTVVDATDLAAPRVVSEEYLPGYAVSSRRVGSSVRIVLSEAMQWPSGVRWWVDWQPSFNTDHDAFVAAVNALEDANERIIRAAPVQDFFPPGQRKLQDGSLVDVSYQCTDFYVSNAPERPGIVTVATMDLAAPGAGVSRTSIFGEPGVVYATAERLYVASSHWWWWQAAGQQSYTYIHLFDIADPAHTSYVASGGVTGTLPDQFALDESGGYLRVATTTAAWSQPPFSTGGWTVTAGNHVSVLAQQSDQLAVVGDSGNLVADEGIRATRFVGDKGFVVTFRGIDPLVTLDLTDPAHPRKVAELTIPGFSTYLQPIDEGHLLAIGTDLPAPDPVTGTVDWTKRAMQLSVFDVSDLENPTRTAQVLVGTMNGYSEAAYDHHAFNWYAQRNLLAIPFSDWLQSGASANWYDQFVSDVRTFRVDGTSITPLGSLGMGDVYIEYGSGEWTYRYVPWVRRSVLATDTAGNDYVYAVSDAGIRVANLAGLANPIATVLFPRQ